MNLVKKDIFDLILLDLSLPDGNGTYICEQVRKFPELYGKPFIIALTADTSQESVNKNLELGCDDYIKKPFDTQELLIRLKKFIKRLPQNKDVVIYENIKLFLKLIFFFNFLLSKYAKFAYFFDTEFTELFAVFVLF